MSDKKITLKDVARAAGVSTAAVSMALKNNPRIGKATRERVKQAADDLGYVSDPKISTLMQYLRSSRTSGFSETIAYLYAYSKPDEVKQALAIQELIEGAETFSRKLGYKIEKLWLNKPGMNEQRMNRILQTRNIRGIILPPHPETHAHLQMDWDRFAVVSHAMSIDYPRVHCINGHHFFSSRLAYQQCWERGYRRIGFAVNHHHNDRTEHRWTGGYLSAIREVPEKYRIPEYVGPSKNEFLKWFRKHRPEVILIARMEFRDALRKAGMNCPGDCDYAYLNLTRYRPKGKGDPLAVPVEYMDKPPQEDIQPGELAGVIQNHFEMGRSAASMVVAALQQNNLGLPEIPQDTMVKGYWIDGTSAPGR